MKKPVGIEILLAFGTVFATACTQTIEPQGSPRANIEAYQRAHFRPRIDEILRSDPVQAQVSEGDPVSIQGKIVSSNRFTSDSSNDVFVEDGTWRYRVTDKSLQDSLANNIGKDVELRGIVRQRTDNTLIVDLVQFRVVG
jgi:hypothetical protein